MEMLVWGLVVVGCTVSLILIKEILIHIVVYVLDYKEKKRINDSEKY